MKAPSQGKRQKPLSEKHRKFTEEWVRTGNAKEACKLSGFSVETAADLVQHAGILKYKAELEKKATALAVRKLGITKADVLNRLAELANISHSETNGNITGQVKACSEIAEIIGAKVKFSADVSKQFEGRSPEEVEFFAQHGYYPPVDTGQSRPN